MNKLSGHFYQKDILSADQFTAKDIKRLFKQAQEYKKGINKEIVFKDLKGKILTALFYEPSSRTFSSFIASMQRLGGGFIPIHGIGTTSVVKGESFTDTIKTFASYSDVIILRHSEAGMPEKAAAACPIPVINAGDGVGEHPTQGLLDLFTIKEQLGRISNIGVALVGDLTHSRTVHSLAKLISLFPNNRLYFVFPPLSPMPKDVETVLKQRQVKISYHKTITEIIKKVDVLYMTRVQKERMSEKLYHKIKNAFQIDNRLANQMKKEALIMSPLPRVGEIAEDVDTNPRATYLKYQMRNGMYIRMALLRLILKR